MSLTSLPSVFLFLFPSNADWFTFVLQSNWFISFFAVQKVDVVVDMIRIGY